MDKTLIGLVAAIAAATPFTVAQAAVTPEDAARALKVSSVAELLDPVPNSTAVLAALDANRETQTGAADEGVQVAQWHHHHHHHHHWWRHHHHHHWYWMRHHHHHHHHHHYYNY
ncbi:MAG TPA: hypothetical protein VN715_11545 [Roseiarcus sp.]|nr:hypothetical protein [Roseiarcus sp.]